MVNSPTTPNSPDGRLHGTPLAGRHAAITGAARGIGWSLCETLAGLGADVTLVGRDLSALNTRAAELGARHQGRFLTVQADAADASTLSGIFHDVQNVDILVNNAGIAPSMPFMKTDRTTWDQVMTVNLTAAFLCMQEVLPGMIERGFGRIVNIASTAGLKGYSYTAAYCASKHGLIGLTRALAVETARTGVTINAVCPGFTDTDLVAGAVANIQTKTGRTNFEARQALAANNPQGRLVAPHEVADAAAWLCLPGSASITGQSIAVAGGEIM